MRGCILKMLFVDDLGTLQQGGITLKRRGKAMFRFFAKFCFFLQDGAAHKQTFHCKGDAGTKFCLLCRNVFARTSAIADDDGSELLVCDAIKRADLDLATTDELRAAARRVASSFHNTPSKEEHLLRERALGFTFSLYNLLCDPVLADVFFPAMQYCHDWMHGVFVGG